MKTEPKNDLDLMCEAIKEFEGWFPPSAKHPNGSRSWRNKNPGNLRKANWSLAIGYDKDNFAIFKTKEDGMKTLKGMIKNAAIGKSQVYKPTDSILTFFKKYAPSVDGNHPAKYASYVALKMGVSPYDFQLQDLTLT